jgi:hypothetical protein
MAAIADEVDEAVVRSPSSIASSSEEKSGGGAGCAAGEKIAWAGRRTKGVVPVILAVAAVVMEEIVDALEPALDEVIAVLPDVLSPVRTVAAAAVQLRVGTLSLLL